MAGHSAGYFALLRHNRAFRLLWYGQVTSQLGDWLDTIALYVLLLRLTGSAASLATLLVVQALPSVLVGPAAGLLADRLPRKAVLIAADLGRAALVLLFLLVREPGHVWIVYLVSFLKFTFSSFFEPAREALVPDVVAHTELVAANTLSSLTWAVLLAGGAALGGAVMNTLGSDLAFVLDAVSFLVSAVCTWRISVRETHLEGHIRRHPLEELREGLAYLLTHRDVAVYALSKTLWSLGGGGVLVLLPLFGKKVFPLGQDGALSMGLLYAARGVGAGLGPVLVHRFAGSSVRALRRALGLGFFLMAAGYTLLAGAPALPAAAGALVLAHFGGSVQWVFSTALLQLSVPARLQGRVFAAELMLLTLALCLSGYATGYAADAGWTPRTLALAVAATFVPSGVALTLLLWQGPKESEAEQRVPRV
jgi:MFS family permease